MPSHTLLSVCVRLDTLVYLYRAAHCCQFVASTQTALRTRLALTVCAMTHARTYHVPWVHSAKLKVTDLCVSAPKSTGATLRQVVYAVIVTVMSSALVVTDAEVVCVRTHVKTVVVGHFAALRLVHLCVTAPLGSSGTQN